MNEKSIHTKDRIIYFAGAIRGDRVAAAEIRDMIIFIRLMGLSVLTEHIIEADTVTAHAKVMGKDRASVTAEDIERQDMAWLDQATHVIAEISGSSTGTGREIEYARNKEHFGKVPAKVLCLYKKERESIASPMVRGMSPEKYPNVKVVSYDSMSAAKEIIKEFLG